MRLNCPNCGAEYEVPEEVIPQNGRDVQCSNCGDTWFQPHPSQPPLEETGDLGGNGPDFTGGLTEPDDLAADETPAPVTEVPDVTAADVVPAEVTPAEEPREDHAEDTVGETGDPTIGDAAPAAAQTAQEPAETITEDPASNVADDVPEETPPAAPRPKRELKEDIASVLREEAEHEARAREAEAMESQPDLGLESADNESARRESEQRRARIKGEDPDRSVAAETAIASAAASRRDLLPDIEEINSTLRRKGETDSAETQLADYEDRKGRKRGFRRGFVLIFTLAVIAVVVYLEAARIADLLPQAKPYLDSYVTWVQKMRLALDDQARALMQWLDGMTSESSDQN
jgi:predicted Zn finger-like uncharacterized protein